MNKNPIGIFDSGVGGMTVLSRIKEVLPNEDIIYLGDTKNFPYGDKSKETIVKLATKCTEFLISKNVKLIIIACGTATSQSLEELKNKYKIPIIGIIKPTILDIKRKENKKEQKTIGIMATEGTIKSRKWQEELEKEISNVTVISKACPLLAPMAEQGWTNNKVARETIKEYLKPFQNTKLSKIILGCTHYPLFKEIIAKELENKVEIIDTGEKTAKYLKEYLSDNNMENDITHKGICKYYLTDIEYNFLEIAKKLIQEEITIDKINLEI